MMKRFDNFVQYQHLRQLDSRYNPIIQDQFIVTPSLINRLGLLGELEGHSGCVNCLDWTTNGKVLASGSDDVHVVLWDPQKRKKLTTIQTGHTGNIFTVKFLPNTGDRTIVSGAADQSVRIHDVISGDLIGVCTCHTNRVKRCVTDPVCPDLFWSAGEDGYIIQHDLRTSHQCPSSDIKNNRNILINICSYLGSKAEAKCLTINPVKTDYIAVGVNDPYVRVYDRRMIKAGNPSSEAVQYFVPGHLPSRESEFKRKYRSLASSYVTFSPDGTELLVNLGGEQIYLFPFVKPWQTEVCNLVIPTVTKTQNGVVAESTNGYSNGFLNGTTNRADGIPAARLDFTRGMRPVKRPSIKMVLSTAAEAIKAQANKAFEEKKYARAVDLYNEALCLCPLSPILYGNRSAALLKRAWDGDSYVAFKDCQVAIYLDPDHYKALLRMSRCLLDLGRIVEAAECFREFKIRYPEHLKSDVCQSIEKDIKKVLPESSESRGMLAKLLKYEPDRSASKNEGDAKSDGDAQISVNETTSEGSGDSGNCNSSSRSSDSDSSTSSTSTSSSRSSQQPSPVVHHKKADLEDLEEKLRQKAIDFTERFCGHCNTTTDIKEANYFGGFIIAGSDDGSFFIWDRKTTNIVRVIKGDESIVNCVQPHPSMCLLATSGIESVVKLWAPMPQEGFVNDKIVEDVTDAAYANQKRMNSNPFEVILMNMGYRLSGNEDEGSDEEPGHHDGPVTACNQQ